MRIDPANAWDNGRLVANSRLIYEPYEKRRVPGTLLAHLARHLVLWLASYLGLLPAGQNDNLAVSGGTGRPREFIGNRTDRCCTLHSIGSIAAILRYDP